MWAYLRAVPWFAEWARWGVEGLVMQVPKGEKAVGVRGVAVMRWGVGVGRVSGGIVRMGDVESGEVQVKW